MYIFAYRCALSLFFKIAISSFFEFKWCVCFLYTFFEIMSWFSKDGAATKFTEKYIPGGGLVTAGFHKAAGNDAHASNAVAAGAHTGAMAAGCVAAVAPAAAPTGAAAGAVGLAAMGGVTTGYAFSNAMGLNNPTNY